MLVTFELRHPAPAPVLRLTETSGERGWEIAVLEEAYQDHVRGWDALPHRRGRRTSAAAP